MSPPRFAVPAGCEARVAASGRGDDDAPMTVIPLIAPETIRCECVQCGAHVMVRRSWQLAGWCRNCRGYQLRPLVPLAEAPTPTPTPVEAESRAA